MNEDVLEEGLKAWRKNRGFDDSDDDSDSWGSFEYRW